MPVEDAYARPLRNLRVSVTDRCNLRCAYCMPEEDYVWLPREQILHFEEIAKLVDVFLDLGVDKVRLTGGEPLLRRNLPRLVGMLAAKSRLRDLALDALAQDDPWGSFEGFMRASARIQTDDRALSEVLTSRPDTMGRAAEASGILELVGQILGRAQAAGAVRKDAHPYDVPMLMCALAGTFRNPHADPERYIGITLDGLRAPGGELTKLPAVDAA